MENWIKLTGGEGGSLARGRSEGWGEVGEEEEYKSGRGRGGDSLCRDSHQVAAQVLQAPSHFKCIYSNSDLQQRIISADRFLKVVILVIVLNLYLIGIKSQQSQLLKDRTAGIVT